MSALLPLTKGKFIYNSQSLINILTETILGVLGTSEHAFKDYSLGSKNIFYVKMDPK